MYYAFQTFIYAYRLCEILSCEELKALNISLKGQNKIDCGKIFTKAVQDLNDQLELEQTEMLDARVVCLFKFALVSSLIDAQ